MSQRNEETEMAHVLKSYGAFARVDILVGGLENARAMI